MGPGLFGLLMSPPVSFRSGPPLEVSYDETNFPLTPRDEASHAEESCVKGPRAKLIRRSQGLWDVREAPRHARADVSFTRRSIRSRLSACAHPWCSCAHPAGARVNLGDVCLFRGSVLCCRGALHARTDHTFGNSSVSWRMLPRILLLGGVST